VLAAHLDPNSLIYQQRSVYFDFNDYTIKTDYAEMIERQGKYLVSAPGLNIKVEGNTDERGSAEYNLSLGQRRAEAVVKALKIYGVRDSQVEAISWGEEKPLAKGNDETAWAQNRRVDLMYPTR
jgi:peptidoglycan-associated lipoprotein